MDDFTRASLQMQLADITTRQSEFNVTAAVEDRALTASEQRKHDKLQAEREALEGRLEQDTKMQRELRKVPRGDAGSPGDNPSRGNPLAVTPEMLDGVQHAIDTRTSGLFSSKSGQR